jgi:hypothetical protein
MREGGSGDWVVSAVVGFEGVNFMLIDEVEEKHFRTVGRAGFVTILVAICSS